MCADVYILDHMHTHVERDTKAWRQSGALWRALLPLMAPAEFAQWEFQRWLLAAQWGVWEM